MKCKIKPFSLFNISHMQLEDLSGLYSDSFIFNCKSFLSLFFAIGHSIFHETHLYSMS